MRAWGSIAVAALLLGAMPAMAEELQPETLHVEKLPDGPRDHWIWVGDLGAQHNADTRAMLVDADKGKMLGMLSTGFWSAGVLLPKSTGNVVALETFFEKGTRGPRHDYVTVYDPRTLLPLHEIEVPPRRMTALVQTRMAGLTDDDRFVAITNFTPKQTMTIVDLQKNRFVAETDTPGCGQIYPAGPRRILLLCGDASLKSMTLDDDGHVIAQTDGKPFFDPFADPVIVHAVRDGSDWLFVSLAGYIYQVDASGNEVKLREKWSLLTDSDRADGWRTGGYQPLAVQKKDGLLYALMRKGPESTYEEPGDAVWVFDIASHKRVAQFDLANATLAIEVSQDAKPIVYGASMKTVVPYWSLVALTLLGQKFEQLDVVKPALDVYDAKSGKLLRTVDHVASFATSLQQP